MIVYVTQCDTPLKNQHHAQYNNCRHGCLFFNHSLTFSLLPPNVKWTPLYTPPHFTSFHTQSRNFSTHNSSINHSLCTIFPQKSHQHHPIRSSAMKDRGKAVAALVSDAATTTNNNNNNNNNINLFSSSSPDLPCPKHPNSSSVGICAYCLKDRLVKLVCSDCGEQRLSSCSCSDISVVEVGSVGRISFLIENEKADKERNHPSETTATAAVTDAANVALKRSSSSTIDVKNSSRNSSKFWRFGRSLFRKKRGIKFSGNELVDDDGKSEIWVSDQVVGISRSKSVSAVRGSAPTTTNTTTTTATATTSGLFDCHSEIGFGGLSTRVSDVNKDWHSETERRSGGFSKPRYGFGLIDIIDDDQDDLYSAGFIDLKLGNGTDHFNDSSESGFRLSKESDLSEMLTESQLFDQYPQFYNCGGSCRITVNDHCNNYNKEMKKKCKKSSRVWKWILKNQSSSATISGRD